MKFYIRIAIENSKVSKIWGSHLLVTVLYCWCLLWNSPPFFFFLGFSDGRWADVNSEQVLHSLSPPCVKPTVSGEWIYCDLPAYLSLSLSLFRYLWNASLHISLRCRPYRTLPSHLINHAIEVNATQQKPVGSESEVPSSLLLFLPRSLPAFRSGVIVTPRQVRFSWSSYFATAVV